MGPKVALVRSAMLDTVTVVAPTAALADKAEYWFRTVFAAETVRSPSLPTSACPVDQVASPGGGDRSTDELHPIAQSDRATMMPPADIMRAWTIRREAGWNAIARMVMSKRIEPDLERKG
ncbi:MAG: hypothetical protein CVU63_25340, partial [Deltaproteobacteria bacterium HGW-Deltaproteobacteria-20]